MNLHVSCDFGKQRNKLHSALERKPGTCYQMSMLPDALSPRMRTGWLARLVVTLTSTTSSHTHKAHTWKYMCIAH